MGNSTRMLSAAPGGAELAQLGVMNIYVSVSKPASWYVWSKSRFRDSDAREPLLARERVLVRLGGDERPFSVLKPYGTDA